MLSNDALESCPNVAIVLTTRDPHTTAADFRRATNTLWKALRRYVRARGGSVEYFGRIEFTTGLGPRSGGYRRIHVHYVVKLRGLEPDAAFYELVQDTWARATGAWRVTVTPLRTHVGALKYLWLDQAKAVQLPPKEWRGMVDRGSQGYFSAPVAELREEARRQLWSEALAFSTGLELEDARLLVDGTADTSAAESAFRAAASAAVREVVGEMGAPAALTASLPVALPAAPEPDRLFEWPATAPPSRRRRKVALP
jgi:hypothetical protein